MIILPEKLQPFEIAFLPSKLTFLIPLEKPEIITSFLNSAEFKKYNSIISETPLKVQNCYFCTNPNFINKK